MAQTKRTYPKEFKAPGGWRPARSQGLAEGIGWRP